MNVIPPQPAKPNPQPVNVIPPSMPSSTFMPEVIPTKHTEAPMHPTPAPAAPDMEVPAVVNPVVEHPGTGVATPCGGSTSQCGEYKVVCYFTNWAWYR